MSSVLARLHSGLRQRVINSRWTAGLTPIQLAAIPPILDNRDCIIEAPTAGGKTEAVLFPTLTNAAQTGGGGVRILYVAPLKALLNDLALRGEKYAGDCGLSAFKWHGDVSQTEKLAQLREPPTLLMTTPESLEAILLRKAEWMRFFKPLSSIIIDEAHSFALGDRGGHLLSLLERVTRFTDLDPQRIALTATLGNPKEMAQWLSGTRRSPVQAITVKGEGAPRDFRIHYFDALQDDDEAPQSRSAFRLLISVVKYLDGKHSIAFVKSRSQAEELAGAIKHVAKHIDVRTHHSAVSRFFREEAERLIKVSSETGTKAILSTSTLELGIDIGELDRVLQIGALASPSAFLQRVGRTGRRQGRSRYFRGFCTDADDLLLLTATVNLGVQRLPEAIPFPKRAFHLMAHQLMCLALETHGISPEAAWELFSKVDCYSRISRQELDRLIGHMVEKGYLRDVDGLLITGDETERAFLGAGWRRLFAVFETAPLYEVLEGKRQVGTLDTSFVEHLETPFLFILCGLIWEAQRVDTKAHKVHARRAPEGVAPKWVCYGIQDVPFETAQEVGRILHENVSLDFLDDAAKTTIANLRLQNRRWQWKQGQICVEISDSGHVEMLTYAGDRINRMLASLYETFGFVSNRVDYRKLDLNMVGGDVDEIRASLDAVFRESLSGPSASYSHIATRIATQIKPMRFSPFCRCLPPDLQAAAQIERTMDIEGTLRLVRNIEVVWSA